MADCVFCKIAAGEIPAARVYEDGEVLAFDDINPQAPVHVLIIPKTHAACGAMEITPENSALVARCFEAAARIAKDLGVTNGFRIVTNNGPDACQSVPHLHFHLLAGRPLEGAMG